MSAASTLVPSVGFLFALTAPARTQLWAQNRSRDTIDDPFGRIDSIIDVRVKRVF